MLPHLILLVQLVQGLPHLTHTKDLQLPKKQD